MKYLDKTAISEQMDALAASHKESMIGESVKYALTGETAKFQLMNWRDGVIAESLYDTFKDAHAALAEQETPSNFLVVHAEQAKPENE